MVEELNNNRKNYQGANEGNKVFKIKFKEEEGSQNIKGK